MGRVVCTCRPPAAVSAPGSLKACRSAPLSASNRTAVSRPLDAAVCNACLRASDPPDVAHASIATRAASSTSRSSSPAFVARFPAAASGGFPHQRRLAVLNDDPCRGTVVASARTTRHRVHPTARASANQTRSTVASSLETTAPHDVYRQPDAASNHHSQHRPAPQASERRPWANADAPLRVPNPACRPRSRSRRPSPPQTPPPSPAVHPSPDRPS